MDNQKPLFKGSFFKIDSNFKTWKTRIASNAKTVEEGRKHASEGALEEARIYLQATDIGGLSLETQMTYEESGKMGFNVYRLMWTPIVEISQFKKKRLQAEQKAMLEHKEILDTTVKQNSALLAELKSQNKKLESQKSEFDRIVTRIKTDTFDAVGKLRCGMTLKEALSLLGQTRVTSESNCKNQYAGSIRHNILFGLNYYSFYNNILQCVIPLSEFRMCLETSQCTNQRCPETSGRHQ